VQHRRIVTWLRYIVCTDDLRHTVSYSDKYGDIDAHEYGNGDSYGNGNGNSDSDSHGDGNCNRIGNVYPVRNTCGPLRSDDQCGDDGDEFAELRSR